MSQATFPELLKSAEAIAKANHITEAQAEGYLSGLTNPPEIDESGKIVVRDKDGKEVTRLEYPSQ